MKPLSTHNKRNYERLLFKKLSLVPHKKLSYEKASFQTRKEATKKLSSRLVYRFVLMPMHMPIKKRSCKKHPYRQFIPNAPQRNKVMKIFLEDKL